MRTLEIIRRGIELLDGKSRTDVVDSLRAGVGGLRGLTKTPMEVLVQEAREALGDGAGLARSLASLAIKVKSWRGCLCEVDKAREMARSHLVDFRAESDADLAKDVDWANKRKEYLRQWLGVIETEMASIDQALEVDSANERRALMARACGSTWPS